MVILLVDEDQLDRRAVERFCRFEAAEAGADDHDFGTLRRHAMLPR